MLRSYNLIYDNLFMSFLFSFFFTAFFLRFFLFFLFFLSLFFLFSFLTCFVILQCFLDFLRSNFGTKFFFAHTQFLHFDFFQPSNVCYFRFFVVRSFFSFATKELLFGQNQSCMRLCGIIYQSQSIFFFLLSQSVHSCAYALNGIKQTCVCSFFYVLPQNITSNRHNN